MDKLRLRFMWLTIRFMTKFMMYGADGMRDTDCPGTESYIDELVKLGDDIRKKI